MIAQVDKPRLFLFYGNSGTGKTTFACSAASADNLTALVDIDNKSSHQMNIRPLVEKGYVDLFPINESIFVGEDLDFVLNPKAIAKKPVGYEAIVHKINDIVKKEPKKYSTIVLDSGTRLVHHLISLIPPVNGKIQMDQNLWKVFSQEMCNRITRLMTVPVNWIWIFHERVIVDEVLKTKTINPSIPGQMGTAITTFFNEVYNTRVVPKGTEIVYACLTHADSIYDARTSGNLKNLERQDLPAIYNKLNGVYNDKTANPTKVNEAVKPISIAMPTKVTVKK